MIFPSHQFFQFELEPIKIRDHLLRYRDLVIREIQNHFFITIDK